jgi:hypothetical protein
MDLMRDHKRHHAAKQHRITRFTFGTRLKVFQEQFEAEHWEQSGPALLHDGWKIG